MGRGWGLRVPLKHINRYRDRTGKMRHYLRLPGGTNIPLPGDPSSPEFVAAYNAALAANPKPPIGESRNEPGTVAQAVSLYFESATFSRLARDTRRTRKNELERFRVAHGEKRMATMEGRHIEKHINRKGPSSARNCLKALTPWLTWCMKEGIVKANPAQNIDRPRSSNKEGYPPWPEEEVERFRAFHPLGSRPRLAFELFVNTGAAIGDVAALGRQHIREGILTYRRSKTGVLVEIPVLPDLAAILADAPFAGRLTFLPYTKESLGNMLRRWCKAAAVPKGYSAHGIREYAAVEHANNGATENELMAWFGWLKPDEAAYYTRRANRRLLAIRAGERMNRTS